MRGLPELSFWATHDGRGLGRGGLAVDPGAAAAVTVHYRDPDGTTRACRHWEGARLYGRGLDFRAAALELGGRRPEDTRF